ncbi:MAG: D-alanyl-D-alanine carboxypeptidase [Lachnospiraceae bacterium]|nr:D-alanyl-D-alanine carboxypeptidase [Lachnospiraceae bacterium]
MERNVQTVKTLLVASFILLSVTGCGKKEIVMPYTLDPVNTAFSLERPGVSIDSSDMAKPFAADLCVRDETTLPADQVDMSNAVSGILCDINTGRVIYAKDEMRTLPPASLTKVMTALVALENCGLDETLTASENVVITESGATLAGLAPGDTMTMDQALHALLMQSANDAAVMIAEHVGGSVEGFAAMMNEKARSLGATGCNFVNPHGLTADGHYVTAYDMYLIFAEAIKYDTFTQIIHTDTYETVYHDSEGNGKNYEAVTTNLFLKGERSAPEGITVIGGKTGTTNAAGNCLVLMSRDSSGNPYVSVILGATERGLLYEQMVQLLGKIG